MLRVVGAGLGRTGTASLKGALEQLLGGRCYHMLEVFERPADVSVWHAAVRGDAVGLDALLEGYSACVDWPAAAFWSELAEANPDALVLLSTRASASDWWRSMERTIIPAVQSAVPADQPLLLAHRTMVREMFEKRFTPGWGDPHEAMAAYERHNEAVRDAVPAERLLAWRPGNDWDPLCAALGVPVPQAPFPHENTTADFRSRQGLDGAA